VALAAPGDGIAKIDRAAVVLERAVVDRFGDRDVLVATKDGRLVVLVPGGRPELRPGVPAKDVARVMQAKLNRHAKGARWQVAAGRPYPGTYGIARSYEEAREALMLAQRLHLDTDAVHASDLLVYRVLVRDQAAIADLVHAVLDPFTQACGGAKPLLQTLRTYFATARSPPKPHAAYTCQSARHLPTSQSKSPHHPRPGRPDPAVRAARRGARRPAARLAQPRPTRQRMTPSHRRNQWPQDRLG
jgi:GGDEF-like domain